MVINEFIFQGLYGASLASGSLSSSAGASANSDCGDDAEVRRYWQNILVSYTYL